MTGLRYSGSSDAYRYYYIDGSVDHYVTDKQWKKTYTVGKEISFEASKNAGNTDSGWSGAQIGGRRMDGARATFYIYSKKKPSGTYRLVIRRPDSSEIRRKLSVNGKEMGEIAFSDEETTVLIPAEDLVKGLNAFVLEMPEEIPEDEVPLRVRSVGLYRKKD